MSKEGYGTIVAMAFATLVLTSGAIVTPHFMLNILAVVSFLLTILVVYFFRDPDREPPQGENLILSPADGKVVEIVDEVEKDFFNEATTRISIFLSVFDVHVNRVPISGQVSYFRYKKGAFIQAFKSDASIVNEQTMIGIENNKTKVLFKQIAGILARRIICNIREGHRVTMGERFGIIKFGSRVDVFLPKTFEINVKLHQKVKGGLSILGVMPNDT